MTQKSGVEWSGVVLWIFYFEGLKEHCGSSQGGT